MTSWKYIFGFEKHICLESWVCLLSVFKVKVIQHYAKNRITLYVA